MNKHFIIFAAAIGLVLTGCASGRFKERQAQRDKVAGTSGMYCEFVSGDEHPDVDVEMNLRMAQRCDANKPFSITGYKNSSENFGLVYCCSMVKAEPKAAPKSVPVERKDDAVISADKKAVVPAASSAPGEKKPVAPAAKDAKDELDN